MSFEYTTTPVKKYSEKSFIDELKNTSNLSFQKIENNLHYFSFKEIEFAIAIEENGEIYLSVDTSPSDAKIVQEELIRIINASVSFEEI